VCTLKIIFVVATQRVFIIILHLIHIALISHHK